MTLHSVAWLARIVSLFFLIVRPPHKHLYSKPLSFAREQQSHRRGFFTSNAFSQSQFVLNIARHQFQHIKHHAKSDENGGILNESFVARRTVHLFIIKTKCKGTKPLRVVTPLAMPVTSTLKNACQQSSSLRYAPNSL